MRSIEEANQRGIDMPDFVGEESSNTINRTPGRWGSAEVLVTTSWTFVVENSYRLIQNVATNSTVDLTGLKA